MFIFKHEMCDVEVSLNISLLKGIRSHRENNRDILQEWLFGPELNHLTHPVSFS